MELKNKRCQWALTQVEKLLLSCENANIPIEALKFSLEINSNIENLPNVNSSFKI